MYTRVTLYLSKDGDNVELKYIDNHTFRSVAYDTDNIHPILKAAETADSHSKVLDLLRNIEISGECQKFVTLYHLHNSKYKGHNLSIGFGLQKGAAHQDSIDQLINFVQQRQQDVSNPSRICRIM